MLCEPPATGVEQLNVIQDLLDRLHRSYRDLDDGQVADYIPELAKACPDDFGIVIATANGRVYEVGDSRKPFTIQSISKPFVYGLGMKLMSPDYIESKVDVEPSGEAFNAISLNPETGKPRNPMINAGAIAISAQICAHAPEKAERLMLDFFADLAGRPLQVDEAVYRSEKQTGHRNRAIGHLLRNFNIIEADPEAALDLYFRQCSILVTCRDLAVMAATLACQGRNPFTGAQPLQSELIVRVMALMGSCGMYDFAGQWLHDVGIPAKSGVAGGVLAVMPGRLGIATYSPPLDGFGNSVRGVAVCRELSSGAGLSLFNQYPRMDDTIRRSYRGSQRTSRRWRSEAELSILQQHRDAIRIIHLQGVLDFGAFEQIGAEFLTLGEEVRILILDLAHVNELPIESSNLLHRQLSVLLERGLKVLISRAHDLSLSDPESWAPTHHLLFFDCLDTALEAAEDLVISWNDPQGGAGSITSRPLDPEQGFLGSLSPSTRSTVLALMTVREYAAGERVIRRGDPGREFFLVRSGTFTTAIELESHQGEVITTRLATFGPGMSFGEISFISGATRSADVVAAQDGSCWVMNREQFDSLRWWDPDVMIELLQALTCDLGRKLAQTSIQLTLMEHY